MPQNTLTLILGGGAGTRLFPLTEDRSKPAVPIAGKFRLIDIPISNCLNSELYRIFILTQFNSGSLNQHVSRTFPMPHFLKGSVEVLAANQTPSNPGWYQGTADAVRQNLWYIRQVAKRHNRSRILILSGDHLYRMDYRNLLRFHAEQKAEITVSVLPVEKKEASEFGILQVDDDLKIVRFAEKPKDPILLDSLQVEGEFAGIKIPPSRPFLASMGIYVFDIEVLDELLDNTGFNDFGKEVLPTALEKFRLFAYPFRGYWRDIGTIRSYYDANLEMCAEAPSFDFFPEESAFYTRPRSLAPSRVRDAVLDHSLITEGVDIQDGCHLRRSIVGLRMQLRRNVRLDEVILYGATRYESEKEQPEGLPILGIDEGSVLRRCIVDKDVRIGKNVVIEGNDSLEDGDFGDYFIRDGLVIIPRKAVIEDNRKIP